MIKLFPKKAISYWKIKLLIFLSVVGPGIITGTADNDAGGVATYSIVGAHFGYQMLWILILITGMLYVTQEMGMRLGIVTGKGLADLIREKLDLRLAIGMMLIVFFCIFIASNVQMASFNSIVSKIRCATGISFVFSLMISE